ncbi:Duo1 [Kluyveromyces lactis]|nr:Duo1 [Kluyveromyces lactis]
MVEHKLDASTISKMIPQIFDQMRRQTGSKNFVSSPASISTQSLLKEQEQLDKIIPVIQNLNERIKDCKEGDMERIKETCHAMNTILDKFISIQSQASYVNSMMNNEEYLGYVASGKSEEEYISAKQKEVEELEKRVKQYTTMNAPSVKPPASKIPAGNDTRKVTKPGQRHNRSGLYSTSTRNDSNNSGANGRRPPGNGNNVGRRRVYR